jgi:hypothetical protein
MTAKCALLFHPTVGVVKPTNSKSSLINDRFQKKKRPFPQLDMRVRISTQIMAVTFVPLMRLRLVDTVSIRNTLHTQAHHTQARTPQHTLQPGESDSRLLRGWMCACAS